MNKFWVKVGVGVEAPDSYKLTNAMYIYKYLRGYNWKDKPICAIIGNMEAECGMNPGQMETGQFTGMTSGLGLVQWTPGSILKNYADSKGMNWYNYKCQLQLMHREYKDSLIPGWQTYDQWIQKAYYPHSYNYFVNDNKSSIATLTEAFTRCYERPYLPTAHIDRRVAFAKKFYNYLKNHNP